MIEKICVQKINILDLTSEIIFEIPTSDFMPLKGDSPAFLLICHLAHAPSTQPFYILARTKILLPSILFLHTTTSFMNHKSSNVKHQFLVHQPLWHLILRMKAAVVLSEYGIAMQDMRKMLIAKIFDDV